MLIESRGSLDAELGALVTAYEREIRESGRSLPATVFAVHDDAAHLVAVVDGRAVGCGSWRPLADGSAEIQRVYVRPAFRNRGIGRQLIVTIEEEALAAGWAIVRSEIGSCLPAAAWLYWSSGYREIPAFGGRARHPYGMCLEKRLSALVQ